jgi:pyrroline-5-carboxylate reductase
MRNKKGRNTMTVPTIAILGAGNMGSCLLGGLIKNGHAPDKLWAADPNKENNKTVEKNFNVHVTENNIEAVQNAEVVVFAVKPQVFASVAMNLKSTMQQRKPLVVSIAAGVRTASIQTWLGGEIAIVRAMPNVAALIGCGASALFANHYVTPSQHQIAESILRAVGVAVWLSDEASLDIVTALSGSGPAYFFLLMESLEYAAEQSGLPVETARLLTLQTALGAARMAIESRSPLVELRHSVTSPGGTTEMALSVLEKNHVREIIQQALMAAKRRSEELAELASHQDT